MPIRTWVLALAASSMVSLNVSATAGAPSSPRMERAKDFIADEQWTRAIEELKAAVADKRERDRDEALFWLAHSENQAQDLAAAIETIARLERDFPRSRWVRPARSLRIEIAQRLKRDDVLWWTATPPPPPPAPPAAVAPGTTPVPRPAPKARPRTPKPPAAIPVVPPAPPEPPAPAMAPTPAPESWVPAPFEPDTDLRIQALGSLLKAHPAQVIPMLKEIALDSKDPGEARRAVFVLAQSGRPDARTTVVAVAQSGPELVRIAAVRELGRFGGPAVSSDLLQVYTTATPRVKREIVSSLAALGPRVDTSVLLRIARTEKDPQVRNVAILTLGRPGVHGSQLASLYAQTPRESRRTVLVALCNSRNEEELIRIASTEREPALRQEARRQLRLLGTPKALKFLAENKD